MVQRSKDAVVGHVQNDCEELDAATGLPFRGLLDEQRILDALKRSGVEFRDRVFNPMTTLYAFLSQVASKEATCETAVSRIVADRVADGLPACSTDTSSYCKARGRLPEQVVVDLARDTGQEMDRQALPEWLFKGRHVKIVDGSTLELEDTPENQAAYPQSRNQKAGLGFPIMRIVVLLSLAVGTVLECAIGPCRGKKTGEQSLFREMWDVLEPNDIVLGDRLYDCYRDIAQLKARGIDTVFGKKQSRKVDFRAGRKLGSGDHIVTWKKPAYNADRYNSREEWEALPDEMEMREIRWRGRRPGFRDRTIMLVTTLLDPEQYSAQELSELFAQRWHCELDLRSLKQAMGMKRLACKTPEMVRKELWVYLLAYNLLRVRMAQAAAVHEVKPRTLSFTAAKTHVHSFANKMESASPTVYARLETELLIAIASCRVGQRPGRKEPRAVKKRKQKYPYLTKPRAVARKALAA